MAEKPSNIVPFTLFATLLACESAAAQGNVRETVMMPARERLAEVLGSVHDFQRKRRQPSR